MPGCMVAGLLNNRSVKSLEGRVGGRKRGGTAAEARRLIDCLQAVPPFGRHKNV